MLATYFGAARPVPYRLRGRWNRRCGRTAVHVPHCFETMPILEFVFQFPLFAIVIKLTLFLPKNEEKILLFWENMFLVYL